MLNKSCPVSLISVDGNIARISASYVGALLCIYLFTHYDIIISFLIIDFIVRLFINKDYSLILFVSTKTKDVLKIQTHLVDSAAKRLASYFALFFLVTIALTSFFELTALLYIVSAILLACIAMEVVVSYCLGCEIYYLYKRFIL